MSYESERLKILEMIDSGLITVDEGVVLLKALDQRGMEAPSLPTAAPGPDVTVETAGFVPPTRTVTLFSQNEPGNAAVEEASLTGEPLPVETGSEQVKPAPEIPTEEPQPAYAPQPEPAPEEKPSPPRIDPEITKWRRFWWIPLWVGVGITVISASLMFLAWSKSGFGFWFACTWFPFALGVLMMALAYASRTARWLHVRVHQSHGEKPQNIAISLPIPLRLTAWFFRTFKGHIPHMGNTGIDELIMALNVTNPDTPFYVEVNEGEDGERVEVYIG